MKTKIGVLLVFLVFLSLSCQKDSGVESAGNTKQKGNITQKGNMTKKDNKTVPRMYYLHFEIKRYVDGNYYDSPYSLDAQNDQEPGWDPDPINFYIEDLDPSIQGVITYGILVKFAWEGCEYNLTWSIYSKIAGFAINHNRAKPGEPALYGCIFDSFLTKQWADVGYTEVVKEYESDFAMPHKLNSGEWYSLVYGYSYYIGGDGNKLLVEAGKK
jgi:hypothetical protein